MQGKFSAFGSEYSGNFSTDAKEIIFEGDKNMPLFYQTVLSGFETALPSKEVKNGIEISREYTTLDGATLKNPKVGDDVLVKISYRAVGGASLLRNVAIVDLQPSCLEVNIESVRESAGLNGGSASSDKLPDYVDSREDRIVIYTSVKNSVGSFAYKAKLVNSGSFVVPPLFAECMYDESVNARTVQGKLEVSAAK